MKSSILTGITLTLLMLLLVLASAFVFLFQGRVTLQERLNSSQEDSSRLQGDLKETATDLADSEATRQSVAEMLATSEADVTGLEGQLRYGTAQIVDLTGKNDALEEELATARDTIRQMSQESEQAQLRQPVVEIVKPANEAVFLPGETVEVVVSAADAAGIAAVSITVDDEPLVSRAVDDKTVHTIIERWTPPSSGSFTISALAASSNDLTSEPVTVTIQVIDIETQNQDVLDQVQTSVAELRGLALAEPVAVNFLTSAELAQNRVVPQASSTESPAASAYLLALSAFDFLQPDFDLSLALADLDQTGLAIHDPTAATFDYFLEDGELSAQDISSHVHQLTHALQAQYQQLDFGAEEVIRSDASDALNALIEGEAELVEFLYQTGADSAVQASQDDANPSAQLDESILSLPAILVNQRRFIHEDGFEFAKTLYEQGGNNFSQIDAAWEEPPASTEQILHPGQFLERDEPILVSLPPLTGTLSAGWELRYEGTLGELFLREYLLQRLTEEPTITATTGWGGDRYAIYYHESRQALVMVLRLVWDTVSDSAEFAALYPNYPVRLYGVNAQPQPDGSECWSGSDVICLSRSSDETVIARAPDLETATSIIQLLASGEGG